MTIEGNVLEGALVPRDDDDTVGSSGRPFQNIYAATLTATTVNATTVTVTGGVTTDILQTQVFS